MAKEKLTPTIHMEKDNGKEVKLGGVDSRAWHKTELIGE